MLYMTRVSRLLLPYAESFLAGFGVGVLLTLLSHGQWHG